MRNVLSPSVASAALGVAIVLSASAPSATDARTRPAARAASAPVVPTFKIYVFAKGSTTLFNPDGVVVTKNNVFVVFQNASDTTSAPRTLVKYDRSGHALGSVNLYGRCDGLRLNPYTNQLWALLNNDGLNGTPPRQPLLDVVDPASLHVGPYTFPPRQPHGGGYDDIAFVGGHAFLSASSPTLAAGGVNDKPVIVEATLTGSNVAITPIAYGNARGVDIPTRTPIQLNITDPDSLSVDTVGDLVLASEGDAQLLFVAHPGASNQLLGRLPVGSNLDESAWTAGTSGTLYVADTGANIVYAVAATFARNTIFSESGAGARVSDFIGTLDPTTGILTPLLTVRDGFLSPSTLVFVPANE